MTQTVGHDTVSNQNERIIDASVIGRFLQKTYITSLFVLFIQAVFVKQKFNLHYFAMGQANIRVCVGVGGGGVGVTGNSFRKIYERLY